MIKIAIISTLISICTLPCLQIPSNCSRDRRLGPLVRTTHRPLLSMLLLCSQIHQHFIWTLMVGLVHRSSRANKTCFPPLALLITFSICLVESKHLEIQAKKAERACLSISHVKGILDRLRDRYDDEGDPPENLSHQWQVSLLYQLLTTHSIRCKLPVEKWSTFEYKQFEEVSVDWTVSMINRTKLKVAHPGSLVSSGLI